MKRVLRAGWGLTEPIRRPIRNRLARFVSGCLTLALETSELALVLDMLVAEQFRLQEMVAALRKRLDEIEVETQPPEERP
jgi:hypothetical protein